jgi:MoxR-like ATPase
VLADREEKRSRLDGLISQPRGGESTALLVHGEPGIGKTMLLEHTTAVVSLPTVQSVPGAICRRRAAS